MFGPSGGGKTYTLKGLSPNFGGNELIINKDHAYIK